MRKEKSGSEGTGVKDNGKSNEICDSKGVMEGARRTNQNGCFTSSELAHQGLPWASTTKKGKEHSQDMEEMEAIKAQISHPYNCSNHPAFHLSACGGRIPLPSPLFYSWPYQLPSTLFWHCGSFFHH